MLEVVALTRRYGAATALEEVSFELMPGELVVLIGRSGAGKTTLLRCIDGLESPDAGRIRYDGDRLERSDAAMVFQEGALVEEKSALRNVLDGALGKAPLWRAVVGWHRHDEKYRAIERLHRVDLAGMADRPVGVLSGGERQRVGLARALQQEPRVLLADEPVASLDPDTGRRVLSLLARVVEAGDLVGLVSLHQPDLARDVADRYVGLVEGRLCLDAPATRVSADDIEAIYDET